jgi:DNA invertase Pin-like site-specific DNA recombinase
MATKYIIYARISSENQRPEQVEAYCSYDAQVQLCKEFIKNNGGKLLSVYQEVCSASRMRKQVLLSIIKNNTNIVIITYDGSRLSRNVSDFTQAYELASSRKIRFATVFPPQIHTHESLLSLIQQSEEEGKAIGRRISAGIQARRRLGAFTGSVAPFGKKIVRRSDNLRVLVDDPQEQRITRLVKLLRESGSSCKEISDCITSITGEKTTFKIYEWIVDPENPDEMMTVETDYTRIPGDSEFTVDEIYKLLIKYNVKARGKTITKNQVKYMYNDLGSRFANDLNDAIDALDEVRNEVRAEVRNEVRNEPRTEIRNEVRNEPRNEVRNEVFTQNSGYFLFYKDGVVLPSGIPNPPQGYTGYIWIPN